MSEEFLNIAKKELREDIDGILSIIKNYRRNTSNLFLFGSAKRSVKIRCEETFGSFEPIVGPGGFRARCSYTE